MQSKRSPTKLMTFTLQQTRQQVINSNLNTSKSKSSWTFSKQKRFKQQLKQPRNQFLKQLKQTSKNQMGSTFIPKNHSYGFGRSKRKVFTEISDAPLPWKYNPEQPKQNWKNLTFGQAREKCQSGSYINKQHQKIPGPAKYKVKDLQKSFGYTMRHRTAHQRTYFLQNKQAMQVPGPGKYDEKTQNPKGRTITSKFRDTITLGSSTLMSKTKRFETQSDRKFILSTSLYDNFRASWQKGCRIGSQGRSSFVQKAAQIHDAPGPGKYQLPSQFGHYKQRITSQFNKVQ